MLSAFPSFDPSHPSVLNNAFSHGIFQTLPEPMPRDTHGELFRVPHITPPDLPEFPAPCTLKDGMFGHKSSLRDLVMKFLIKISKNPHTIRADANPSADQCS